MELLHQVHQVLVQRLELEGPYSGVRVGLVQGGDLLKN